MIKNYLLISIRHLFKNKVFILINVLGMSVAIGCCIVAYYNYNFNATFDDHHVRGASIYRVNSIKEFEHTSTEYGYAPEPLGEAIRQNIGDVDGVFRLYPDGTNIKIKDEIFTPGMTYVDSGFFDAFTFDFIEGSAKDLRDKSKVFLSEEQAVTFFGNGPAVGKTLQQVLVGDKLREFTVGGVFRVQPANSSFRYDLFTLYENYVEVTPELKQADHWKYRNQLFVLVKDPSRVPVVEAQLKPYADNNNKVREDFIISGFHLDPLVGMGLRDRKISRPGVWTWNAAPISAAIGTAMMAILILLIACFNLTNTAVSVSSQRLKEIGIRKVMGGLRSQLIVQFMGETMFICFVSLGLGMLIAEVFLIPAFNSLWPYMKIATDYTGNPQFLIFLVATLIFAGLVAGSYPALYITRFQPIAILKGKLKFGGSSPLSKALLVLQYAFSLVGIVCGFAFTDNATYQRDYDLGFDRKGVVYTYINDGKEFETYKNALAQNPKILNIAGSANHIFSSVYNDPIKHEGKQMEVDIIDVGDNYLKTVGFHLIEGRDFRKDSESDVKESVIVTEKLVSRFGWDKPIGKEIVWMDTVRLYVIGVVKTAYTQGLWREMEPMMIRFTPQAKYTHVLVSTDARNVIEVNKFMEKTWKQLFANRAYNGRYMDDQMAEAVKVNTNIVKMFVFLGAVALMLSVTGLFTLVSLNIIKKMKEIGVRKVFGASVGNITRIINTEFVILLLIASVLGSFLGNWLSAMLMHSIWAYYQTATFAAIGISVAILLVVSALAIAFKVYNTAKMNPVNTLRDE